MNKTKYSSISIGSLRRMLIAVVAGCIAGFVADRCTIPYEPALHQTQEMLVVDGHIIKGEKVQTIQISRSAAYQDYKYYPESGCLVRIVDGNGRQFGFTETGKGIYTAAIPDELIKYNNTYQLFITTPDNQNYESTPEILFQATPVDSLYYFEETVQTVSTGVLEGVQFYTDIKAKEGNARNYRWTLEETWEYRRKFPLSRMWDGTSRRIITLPEAADSLIVCYVSGQVGGFYSSSTANLQVNEKKRIPLSFVSNQTPRLERGYCLIVRQYSLSDNAYNYFNTKKNEIQGSGGLYETQPLQTTSNLSNSDKPGEKVLGYFWASSYSVKRVFAKPPFHFVLKPYCNPEAINWEAVGQGQSGPTFYVVNLDGVDYTAEDKCFDCTQSGGVTTKPDFWK